MNGFALWRAVASYAAGVWGGLTVWAALAQYVLPGRGHALGKLGSFYWVFLISVVPALLCALGFATGLAAVRGSTPPGLSRRRVPVALLGLLFPLTLLALRPLFGLFDAGLMPALAWCVLGSVGAGGWLAWWERRRKA